MDEQALDGNFKFKDNVCHHLGGQPLSTRGTPSSWWAHNNKSIEYILDPRF